MDVHEDPHVRAAGGSSPFDDEGVVTRARSVVDSGVLQAISSSYSARKLGPAHHRGTPVARTTSSCAAAPRRLGMTSPPCCAGWAQGLFVTELMGRGVNYVTGDYSRGASGFWVENGELAYPVHEVTIAGNLKDMLRGIVGIGADAYTVGAKTVGSVLIDRMKLAGH